MSKIFYRTPDASVSSEIKSRQYRYGAKSRAGQFDKGEGNSFVGGKTAYATVQSLNTAGNKQFLGYKRKGFESVYSVNTSGDSIKPRPVLTSVNIRQDGDIGTIQKCTVTWKVFSINQLEQYNCNFLSVGTDVEIKYGWTAAQNSANRGTFVGVVYNINFSLDKDGGFICSFEAVGPGFNTLGTDPTSITSADAAGAAAMAGAYGVYAAAGPGSIIPVVQYSGCAGALALDRPIAGPVTHGTQHGKLIAYQLKLCAPPKSSTDADGNEVEGEAVEEIHYYALLGDILAMYDKKGKLADPNVNLKYDELGGYRSHWLKSPAPQLVVFPGVQGDYSATGLSALASSIPDITAGAGGAEESIGSQVIAKAVIEYDALFAGEYEDIQRDDAEVQAQFANDSGGFGASLIADLTGIQINLNTIQSVTNALSTQKQSDRTLKAFLTMLFDVIREVSGGIYDIVVVPDEDGKTLHIVNRNYVPDTAPTPIEFKPFGTQSVVRDMSLTSKLPDAMASVAYVTARGGGGMESEYPDKSIIAIACNEVVETSNNAKAVEERISSLGQAYAALGWHFYAGIRKFRIYDPQNLTHKMDGDQQSAAAVLTRHRSNSSKEWNSNPAIPLNLSVTLDGIYGFKFGDVVTTNYMPKRYRDKIVFTVTKVNHTIQNQDWTTQIETVCRLKK